MDRSKRLILRDGEDITKDLVTCTSTPKGYSVIFRNNKTIYNYSGDRIVLSTTFSSVSSLGNYTYDYLIMDEASQVDIATGALALSSAENAVVVGDLKQLPNVVTPEIKMQSDEIFKSYSLIVWQDY